MAHLKSDFSFIGPLGDLSAYKRWDSDKTILRRKGGASKEKIKNADEFANVRRTNSEFGGRSTGSKWIRLMLGHQKALSNFGLTGALNALLRPIQKLDTVNDLGRRSVLITKNPALLQGFNLNKRNPFDQIVKNPCQYTILRSSLQATIDLPAMIPGINFSVPGKYPMFRFIAEWGVVPDLFYTPGKYQPSLPEYNSLWPVHAETGWYPCTEGSPSSTLYMEMTNPLPDESCSLMLSVGICFGTVGNDSVSQQKRAGAAKILAMG